MTTPRGHRRLILTRHAKSAWDDPALPDAARPLNGRGKRGAQELGQWLTSRGYLPDEVLCSTAVRTRETLSMSGVAVAEPRFVEALYHASPDVMLAVLHKAQGQVVWLLGHNPGIAEFAARLVAQAPHHPDFARYPTGATLVVDFDGLGWAQVAAGEGAALDFFVPSGRD